MAGVKFPAFPKVDPLAAEDITDLGNTVLQGDLRSNQWDGGSDLSGGADGDASAGFYIDSSAGVAQFMAIHLTTGAIGTPELADGSVTTVKLDALAVTTAKIDDAAITNAKIGNLAVDTAQIANAAVTNAKIDTLAASKITAGTINTGTINVASLLQMSSGGTFQTAPSGNRRVRLRSTQTDRIEFVSTANSVRASLILNSSNQLFIQAHSGTPLFLESVDQGIDMQSVGSGNVRIHANTTVNANLTVSGGTLSTSGGSLVVDGVNAEVALTAYRPGTSTSADIAHFRSNVGGGTNNLHALIKQDGDMENTNNSYGSLSDRRLKVKASIKPARSYLEDLRRLPISKYRFKRQKKMLLGPIAQDVQPVFPGLVTERSDGYLGVKHSVFVPMLITAVQELADDRDRLAERVSQLETAGA